MPLRLNDENTTDDRDLLSELRQASAPTRPSLARPQRPKYIRTTTFPLYHSSRKKPRRWPLALRFIKGAIHADIAIPVILHVIFAALVVYVNNVTGYGISLPSSTIPSLSIVVGLMLVFRNQTSYDRFWQGNQHFTAVGTSIRNLTRSFLTCSHATGKAPPTDAERADTERAVRILLAMIYAIKNHLRAEWGATIPLLASREEAERRRRESQSMRRPEYTELLPSETRGFEDQGLGLTLQLSVHIEAYIKRGHDRGWFHAPQASQLTVQLNTLVAAYGSMESIHLTPLPVAYLIHMRQVLGLFCAALSFAFVKEMGWWSTVLVLFISFTLYGIEAIGAQIEDPFGYDKADLKLDTIVEDHRVETMVLLEQWRRGTDIFAKGSAG